MSLRRLGARRAALILNRSAAGVKFRVMRYSLATGALGNSPEEQEGIMQRIKSALSIRFAQFVHWILDHPLVAFLVATVFIAGFYLILRGLVPAYAGFVDNALGGLIASLGTAAFLRQFLLQRESYSIKQWLRLSTQNIWIIPTYLGHESERYPQMQYYVVPPFDAQAAGFLTQVLRMADARYPRRKALGSHRFWEGVLKDNLVMLCLPERNQYTRIFLGLYNEIYVEGKDIPDVIQPENIRRYVEDKECQRTYFGLKCEIARINSNQFREWKMRHFGMPPGQEWWRSSINIHPAENVQQPGRINYDFAMIVKGPNPLNLASSILIVCGIHGIGTLAGALYVYQHANTLFGRYPEHAQAHLVQVRYTTPPGVDNYVDADILAIDHLYYLPLHSKIEDTT